MIFNLKGPNLNGSRVILRLKVFVDLSISFDLFFRGSINSIMKINATLNRTT